MMNLLFTWDPVMGVQGGECVWFSVFLSLTHTLSFLEWCACICAVCLQGMAPQPGEQYWLGKHKERTPDR
jgi:hypothetical protein